MLLPSRLGKMFLMLFVVVSQFASAQQLSPSTYNFGKVSLWNNPKAKLTFTNTSSQRVLFLPIPYQRNLYFHLPEGYINPGQTVEIEAIYYTEEKGNFTVNQPLYLSGWSEPVYLNLKGKILTFHPDAHIACPNMGQEQKKESSSQIASIEVRDAETGELLNGVDILMVGTSKNFFIEKSNKTRVPLKKIGIGLYQIDVSKPGYVTKQQMTYINKNTEVIIVELQRSPHDFDVIETTSTGNDEDEIIEIEKPKESDQDAIEKIRKMMDEKFKGRKIIEKDVMVLKEGSDTADQPLVFTHKDTSTFVADEVVVDETPKEDFSETGELNNDKYASNNIVFLIDESSSMMLHGKIDVLQASMKKVIAALRKDDMVSVIVYSKSAEIRLQSVSGDQKSKIYAVIDSLKPGGRSYGAEGLSMSYKLAKRNFIVGGNNQVILATDGLFNSPDYTERDMFSMATTHAAVGVPTTVVGFGKNKEAIIFLKTLASSGGGSFIQVTEIGDVENALLTEIMHRSLR